MQKLFLALGVVLFTLLTLCSFRAEAAPRDNNNTLTQVTYQKEGDEGLMVALSFDRPDVTYHIEKEKDALLLTLENVRLGRVSSTIALDGRIGKNITFDRSLNRVTVRMALGRRGDIDTLKIHPVAGSPREARPPRLIIEMAAKQGADIDEDEDENEDADNYTKGNLDIPSSPSLKGKIIILDPGHGGSDSGAVGPTGAKEKNVTLAVAKKVQSLLQASGARVVMTRTDDRDVYMPNDSARDELQARVDKGNGIPANIFLSIHCNSFSSPTAHGTETYYFAGSAMGRKLAEALDKRLIEVGGLVNRGVKTANFYVLKHSPIPASLVELAFISNPEEEALLTAEDFQNRMAKAIVLGLEDYFRTAFR